MKKPVKKLSKNMLNNRELSWLSFNERVLQEAMDPNVPLMQRLRFLGIYSNNLDEFTRVRVANLERLERYQSTRKTKLTGDFTPTELLTEIHRRFIELQSVFEQTYDQILTELGAHGIRVRNEKQLTEQQKTYCREYFAEVISPQTVPLMLRKTTQIPFLRDGRIYHAVKMTTGKKNRYAIIEIPVNSRSPRFVVMPSTREKTDVIFIDDIIRLCLDDIFFMFDFTEISAYTIKLMRDSELTFDDDVWKSLIQKMEQGLDKRLHGRPIRLVYDKNMPKDLHDIITRKLGLQDNENQSPGGRYHLMRDLMKFPRLDPSLESVNPDQMNHPDIPPFSSVLRVIRKKDVLLNFPYHTFNPIIDLLREAAVDPRVVSISMTLYRTADRSKIINALVNAAKNGKKVVVFLELLARFDEERNIDNTEILQEAGVKVINGIEGLKVHSKLILVERREMGALRGYAHVGTGNFNEDTARLYTDFSLLTAHDGIVEDVRKVFNFLEDSHRRFECDHLLSAPYYMRNRINSLIKQEIRNAQAGKPAYILAKMNSLTDEKMVETLYKASKAGVKIRLIVRGACCLQPGVEGVSENIRAISIVDRYLEHSRVMIFHAGAEELTYISSADWMPLYLDRRVEAAVPVYDKKLKKQLRDIFELQWADNDKARDLGTINNEYIDGDENIPEEHRRRSQVEIYEYWEKINRTEE